MSFNYNSAEVTSWLKSSMWAAVAPSVTTKPTPDMSKTGLLTQLRNLAKSATTDELKNELYDHIVAVLAMDTQNGRDAVGQFLEEANAKGDLHSIALGNRILDCLFTEDGVINFGDELTFDKVNLNNAMIFLAKNSFFENQDVQTYMNEHPGTRPTIEAHFQQHITPSVQKKAHLQNSRILPRIREAMALVLAPSPQRLVITSVDAKEREQFGINSPSASPRVSYDGHSRGGLMLEIGGEEDDLEDGTSTPRSSIAAQQRLDEVTSGVRTPLMTAALRSTEAHGRNEGEEEYDFGSIGSRSRSNSSIEDECKYQESDDGPVEATLVDEKLLDGPSSLNKVWTWLTTDYGKNIGSTVAKIVAWAAIVFTGVIPALLFIPLVCAAVDAGKRRFIERIMEVKASPYEKHLEGWKIRQDEEGYLIVRNSLQEQD